MNSVTENKHHGRQAIDETGNIYGRLTVIKRVESRMIGAHWLCQCECGNTKIVKGSNLRTGDIQSCGCWNSERASKAAKENNTTHGLSKHGLYQIWHGMKKRCLCKTDPGYRNYGGRGIAICDEWMNDVQAFIQWAISSGYRKGLTIDRKDNNGSYSPENCRWATIKQQSRNTRNTIMVTYKGMIMSFPDFVDMFACVTYNAARQRFRNGWSLERIANTPARITKRTNKLS